MGSYGMEVLAVGEEPITVDIIFVHGLRGDRRKTWTKGNVLWPESLLKPRFPNARIMTWGYDADVMKFMDNTGQSSISNHADQLLQDLSMERMTPEERNRAIVFVAHSLGGIVVKDALCKAYDESKEVPVRKPRVAAIKSATMGIVFLGTPHRGSNQTRWASVANNIANAVLKDHNDKVVAALCRGAETLERVQTSFSRILITLPVWSFFEDQRYGKVGKIVDDDSATLGLPHEEKGWIPASHTDMTKFDDVGDVGFKRVNHAIRCLVEDGLETREAAKAAADKSCP
ncbi:hypothetical protein N431DRAFT_552847 [Stipitochalara longipes BDJ]|nr:hypothetical protein N431DRAFT_552847 [Stipitochalara longipes BDJ]